MLSEVVLLDALREGLWTAVIISGPILAVAFIVGLAVGLFQALTSIQELTLTAVPKLVAIMITFWIGLGMMSRTMTTFFVGYIIPLIAGSGR
ncbi:MAG: flagellar biosynthetic protein FliQ [Alphaproteobacteria bacterium]|nr:flagellar biosynthetic protein FliQ [Alphaproteobacteria bacterium]